MLNMGVKICYHFPKYSWRIPINKIYTYIKDVVIMVGVLKYSQLHECPIS